MSARLLLQSHLATLDEFEWWVVSGDSYDDAPPFVRPVHVPMRRELVASDPLAFLRLLRFFRRNRFSFVQTHTPKASMLALPAAKLAGQRTFYTVHGSLYFRENGARANAAAWLFERWCCAWADRVLVQSREDLTVLPQARICPAHKISFVGNGIDLSRFADWTDDARGDPPVVLMISRLVVEKGCEDFFHVAEQLRGAARFVHVGHEEHDQRDAVAPERRRYLAEQRIVEFVGEVADVRPHIARADLLVQPSYREGIPRAVMEASAMGRPVVAYDIRGVREVVPADTGLLVPRGRRDALVGRVAELLANREALASIGGRCRDWVTRNFSEEAVVERLRAAYASATERR